MNQLKKIQEDLKHNSNVLKRIRGKIAEKEKQQLDLDNEIEDLVDEIERLRRHAAGYVGSLKFSPGTGWQLAYMG